VQLSHDRLEHILGAQKNTLEKNSANLSKTAFHLPAGTVYILAHDTLP
jgi:hypothetical protein